MHKHSTANNIPSIIQYECPGVEAISRGIKNRNKAEKRKERIERNRLNAAKTGVPRKRKRKKERQK